MAGGLALIGGGPAWVADRFADCVDLRRTDAPMTAPAPTDPVPASDSLDVVVVVGAGCLGRVIADRCDRPLRVAALASCQPYERLSVAGAARALGSRRGLLALVPDGARTTLALVGDSDDPADRVVLGEACRSHFDHIVVLEVDRGG